SDVTLASTCAIHHLPDQLATSRIDVFAAGRTYRHIVPGFVQDVLKTADRMVAGPLISGMRGGIEGSQVDLAGNLGQQSDHLLGVLGLVVDALEQGVFDGEHALLAQPGDIVTASAQHHGQRILLVDRHQLVAQLVVGRMQRQRQGDVDHLAQAVDHRRHTRGGKRHLALGNTVAEVVHHEIHGGDHVVEIEQRLTHAHHHHVGDGTVDLGRHAAERLVGDPHLADDLGGRQIAVESLLAGRAETAIQRTARLRGDAQRSAAVLRDIHGFDTAARSDAHHPFAGAVAGNVFADHFRSANFGRGLELFTQGLADVAHGIEVIDAKVVNPLHDLTGTKALLPDGLEEAFQLGLGQPQQIDFTGGGNHGIHLSLNSANARADFGFGEEVGDFASSGSFGVGAVNGVLVDGYGKVGANGARSSFFRVGGTHQLAVLGDGVLTFKYLDDDRTGGHEGDQIIEETADAVVGVEAGGFALAQLNHLGSDDAQDGHLEAGGDFAEDVLGDGGRLDDGEGAVQGHLKLQTDGLKQTSKPADYTRVRGRNIRAASSRSARGPTAKRRHAPAFTCSSTLPVRPLLSRLPGWLREPSRHHASDHPKSRGVRSPNDAARRN